MGKANAQIAQHGGVGQVALPAGDRQLAGQVLHDRVGDAQVAFGVFEVDRVDLVRHGRGADFTRNGLLFEVAEGDIGPDIAIKVDQNGIEARDCIEQLGDVVVRLDLGGVRVELQAQGLLDELLGVGFPVDCRIGGQVGVVVADRTIDLAQQRNALDLGNLALQTVNHVGQLLAEGGRGGRLTVGAREHGHVGVLLGERADGVGYLAHQRQDDLIAAAAQHQRVGQVVDVLGGAGKVDELADLLEFVQLFGLLLEQVLNGLDVVIGGALDFLDALCVRQVKVLGQAVEDGVGSVGERCNFTDARVRGQALQPANLYLNAETDQAVFAENRAQSGGFAAIAAINRGYGGQGSQLHSSLVKGWRKRAKSYTSARRFARLCRQIQTEQTGGKNQPGAKPGRPARQLVPQGPGEGAGKDNRQIA